MSGMVFSAGKWEGAAPADLPLDDVVWIMRHTNHQLDRIIALEDLRRRHRAATQRRIQDEQRVTSTRGDV